MPFPRWRQLSRLARAAALFLVFLLALSSARPAPSKKRVAAPRAASVPLTKTPTKAKAPAPRPSTTTAPMTTAPSAPRPAPAVWAGKGMWIWQPEYAEDGDGSAVVSRALADGITTIYVRTGSSHDGLTVDWALGLLPTAHAAGIRVIGWDFPELDDVVADVARGVQAVNAAAADGSRLDGFAADIETQSEGTNLSPETASEYGNLLRSQLPSTPLVSVVPNPSPAYQGFYPYAEALSGFDAVAPMVYWLNRDPASDVADAIDFLASFGKPIAPIGQAFDGGPEGGHDGQPSADELSAFAQSAAAHGAAGLSFWSWQHADDGTFASIGSLPEVGEG